MLLTPGFKTLMKMWQEDETPAIRNEAGGCHIRKRFLYLMEQKEVFQAAGTGLHRREATLSSDVKIELAKVNTNCVQSSHISSHISY